jgi:hypothetical protein
MKARTHNPHNLPDRLYERAGRRNIAWWVKAPGGTTFVIRTVPASADADQIDAARQAAIQAFKMNKHWKAPTDAPDHVNWPESYGRVDAEATRVKGGTPMWAAKLYNTSKRRATQRGIVWSLSAADFRGIVERCAGLCEVSGVPLMLTITGLKGPYGPSLDRIESRGTYAKDNVRIVCVAVNFALNSWGLDAFLPIARALAAKHPYSKVSILEFDTSKTIASTPMNMAEWTGLEPATPGVTGRSQK